MIRLCAFGSDVAVRWMPCSAVMFKRSGRPFGFQAVTSPASAWAWRGLGMVFAVAARGPGIAVEQGSPPTGVAPDGIVQKIDRLGQRAAKYRIWDRSAWASRRNIH